MPSPGAIKSHSLVLAVLLACISAIPALFPNHLVSLSADSRKSSQATTLEVSPKLPRQTQKLLGVPFVYTSITSLATRRVTVTLPVCLPNSTELPEDGDWVFSFVYP